ncbi:N-acetylglucosamine-6-phosphate deacetylase [Sandaracinobacter sp. RS1-74]|uniref:N-acetylglucosamine-6-phosphate deacetylase n=1 Tax=Sandaracinobacteroides sayramensis TaxID=2913411 RepID=UPI001EDA88E6|nr:N-acetylglucosamine-6-phosphate deacetylase [Sandaracinobacteroides sayramensis]MCG2842100.1 N-acetylglucosamine-6-phosphate deacetylase [Sandaracinobacteroides sayramensis]
MRTRYLNGSVLSPDGLRAQALLVEDGLVSAVGEAAQTAAADAEVDLGGDLLLPGFIDLQVNGGGGVLFNDETHVEGIARIAAAHRRFGSTGILPTLISDTADRVARALDAVDAAIAAGVPGILGIHVEGPFISPARHGIHREDRLTAMDEAMLGLLARPRRGVRLLTVAPEVVPPASIARLVEAGVVVALGHSDADWETVRAALAAGATGFTHLFNAMSQLVNRAPGMVGAALEDADSYAGIILDGHHIHPASFRVALRAKGAARLMLVTDAMPSVGSDAAEFLLQGRLIRRKGDVLTSDDGVLAGSTLDMLSAVRNAMAQGGLPLETAVGMATASPAAFLGLPPLELAPGRPATMLRLSPGLELKALWIDGRTV